MSIPSLQSREAAGGAAGPVVEARDLEKRYRRVDALNGVSFSVEEGSALALIGANGAGKTTALKLLVNLLQPSSGQATIFGIDSRRIAHEELARIGYVSENQLLPGRLTVADYFDYLRPFYRRWDRGLEREIRRHMQLPSDRRIRELSHGMRMKMALACALPFRPELLILDEPLSGLDPLSRDEVLEGVLGQAGEMTIVVSSQELNEIENVVTHVGFLDGGRLLFVESMDDLRERVRAVRVTVEAQAGPPPQVPATWINVRVTGSVLTFVDTQYAEQALGEQVRSCVARVRRIETEALSLRSIFTALARAARDGRADLERATP